MEGIVKSQLKVSFFTISTETDIIEKISNR